MPDDRVVIVVLRQPRSDPSESRADPYWEFGSFGTTACHKHNILHPKNKEGMNGVRLAFAQGGQEGFKLVYLTPPIEIKEHKNCCEAKWKGEMPFSYKDAPLLVNNDGTSLFSLLKQEIAGASRKLSWMQKLSSKFRSRCKPLDNNIGAEVVRVYREVTSGRKRADSYIGALPCRPPLVESDRRRRYEERIRQAEPYCQRKV